MPELPEVEVVRAGIEPAVTGARVAGVEVFDPRSLRRHDPSNGSFTALLEGWRMLGAVRRGKFLWVPLEGGRALVAHLGMSGQLLLRSPGHTGDRLLRIRLHLDHPDGSEYWLNFVDQRIFGSMAVDALLPTPDGFPGGFSGTARGTSGDTDAWATLPSQVAHIARDPIDPAFRDDHFLTALSAKRTGVKRAILDQTLISGIGNIYADEALFTAQIHYAQPASSLSRTTARSLLAAVRTILHKALAEGGTSFDAQYVNVNGESGYFAHSLLAYGQHGKPCPRCGTILVREAFMNRSSHLCPRCQTVRTRPHPAD
jgi:formamidopyrimidine-DNA glycosylase